VGLVIAAVTLVLGVVIAALPFVVVGALGYGPYLMVRRSLGYPRRPVTAEVRRVVPEVPRVRPVAAAVEVPSSTARTRRPRGVVVRVLSEVFCGAMVGGVVGAVAMLGPAPDWHITGKMLDCAALGAGIGAVVGFVVGGPRPTPTEKTPAVG
jgi:hypothetical protein